MFCRDNNCLEQSRPSTSAYQAAIDQKTHEITQGAYTSRYRRAVDSGHQSHELPNNSTGDRPTQPPAPQVSVGSGNLSNDAQSRIAELEQESLAKFDLGAINSPMLLTATDHARGHSRSTSLAIGNTKQMLAQVVNPVPQQPSRASLIASSEPSSPLPQTLDFSDQEQSDKSTQ